MVDFESENEAIFGKTLGSFISDVEFVNSAALIGVDVRSSCFKENWFSLTAKRSVA